MMSAVGSVVAGVLVALVAVLGGVKTISSAPNSAAKSESVVLYDAR